jgi:hypothetical protein
VARKTALVTGEVATLRSASAALAADSATLTDANFPVAGAIDCSGFDSILVGVEITAGTNPTETIVALFRDAEAADGARWKRLLLGAAPGVTATALANETTGALTGTSFAELRVFGAKQVFLRIAAVANESSTTAWKILGMPGRTRDFRKYNR